MSTGLAPNPQRPPKSNPVDDVKELSDVSDVRGYLKLAAIAAALFVSAAAFDVSCRGIEWLGWAGVAVVAAVWCQHAVAEEIHDGCHYRLLRERSKNELIYGLYCSLLGMSLKEYRTMHWLHHRHFGTPEDPDYPKYSRRPEGVKGWSLYLAANYLGVAAVQRVLNPPPARAEPESRWGQHPLGTAVVQLALWGSTAWLVHPLWYVACWVAPLLTVTYGMTQLRVMLEHWNGKPSGGLFDCEGRLQANLFAAPFGYNYHGTHHRYPSIPNYRLGAFKKTQAVLREESMANSTVQTTGFLSRLRKVAAAKTEPRVCDSTAVADEVAKGGTLRFYWRTFRSNPMKIVVGVWDTLREMTRFVAWPRVKTPLGVFARLALLRKFIVAELKIPGGTTVLETIWLTYAAASATNPSRNWVEVGCFKGLSSVRLSQLCARWNRHLHVCDTFEGLPGSDAVYAAVDGGVAYHFKVGSYAGSQEEVRGNLERHGYPEHVSLVKGDVQETLRQRLVPHFSFAFLDVDLVESYRSCFEGLAPSIGPGTVIVIHEACYAPVRELIEDVALWAAYGCGTPKITYIADRYKIRSCRNLAVLNW